MKKSIVNSNHYLALGVSVGIFLCSILAFIFVYYRVDAQMANTASAYDSINQTQLQENQARQVISTLSGVQNQLNIVQSFFVRDDQTLDFINKIEGVGIEAGKANVTIASISDDDLSSAAVGTIGNIHAHIDILGSWSDAMRAFHLMESLPYGESIDNVRITPASVKEWSIEFDLTAVLVHK